MPALVSVVMPVRNAGGFLAGAVDSILRQSHERLELLVVDDHSTDGALDALNVRDHRVRFLKSPRRGVAPAFNFGLAHCRGDYVARMDADDIAAPQRLARQLELMVREPDIGIAGAQVAFFSGQGVGQGNAVYRDWLNSLLRPDAIRLAMFIESPIPNPTALFRRSVLERLGGYDDPDWPEDYDLFLRADAAGVGMAKPTGVLLQWRDHADRLTRTDRRYSLENFQRAKIHYLARSRLPHDAVKIWGAGPTGKLTCDLLLEAGVEVTGFIDVHPRRVGGRKRGRPVSGIDAAAGSPDFLLIAVGARNARARIRGFLVRHGREEGRDFLFVA